jgi:uncharacterized membrane protein
VVAIGLVMLVLAALVTVGIVFFNGDAYSVDFFGLVISNLSIGGLFLAGVIAGVVGTAGVALLLSGGARKRHKKTARKKAAHEPAPPAEDTAKTP